MAFPKILVVDDSRAVRTVVEKTLASVGYDVVTAADGLEAVELAKIEQPQLAIVDICMPFLDGYGVCDELRKLDSPLRNIPIIFLTSLQSHALELLGNSLGAYLHKPVCPDALRTTVREVLRTSSAWADDINQIEV